MLESDVLYANYTGPGVVRVRRAKNQAESYIRAQVIDHAKRNGLPHTITVRRLSGGVNEISWVYEDLITPCKHLYRLISVEHFTRISGKSYHYHCMRCGHEHVVHKIAD